MENDSIPKKEDVVYEDISHQVYPERSGTKATRNLAENFITLRCREKVRKSFQTSPLVKLLFSALKSKGCLVDIERHISCENCAPGITGGYDINKNQIVICHNQVYTQSMTQAVISHELIHMFDYCRAKVDFNNLEHVACSEIRAANLVHCSMTSSFFGGTTGPTQIKQSHRECVHAKALASIMSVRKNFPIEEGVRVVDKVFDQCYADLEPFGRRIRLNSKHPEWAYRERFHYDYDSFV